MLGLKENVIIGKLIPAGTGMECYRNVEIEHRNLPDIYDYDDEEEEEDYEYDYGEEQEETPLL